MKFGSYLIEHSVPEWESKYIKYKKLKKLIKTGEVQYEKFYKKDINELQVTVSQNSPFSLLVQNSETTWEANFFVELDKEVTEVEKFYTEQFKIAAERLEKIKEQVDLYERSKDERQNSKLKSIEEINTANGEEDVKLMSKKFKKLLSNVKDKDGVELKPTQNLELFKESLKSETDSLSNDVSTEESNKIIIKNVVSSNNLQKTSDSYNRCSIDSSQLIIDLNNSEKKPFGIFHSIFPKKTNVQKNLTKIKLSKAKVIIKESILENYRFLELLKNFKVLNSTALIKILKKFDKGKAARQMKLKGMESDAIGVNKFVSEAKNFSELVEKDEIFTIKNKDLNTLFLEVENLFVHFTGKKRGKAMKQLRIPEEKSQYFVTWISGLLIGLSIPIIFQLFYSLGYYDGHIRYTMFKNSWNTLIQIYMGLSLPVFFLFIYSFTQVIWSINRINYVFIFEFDPRDHLSPIQFNQIGAILMFLLSYLAYCHLHLNWAFLLNYTSICFGIIFSAFLLFLINPLNFFYKSSRYWLIISFWRILCSGYYHVEFRDFFLCDLMSSMTYSFISVELLVCSFVNNFSNLDESCEISTSYLVPLATSIPSWWRLLQCLRRFKDEKKVFPHLNNAFKYVLSLNVIFFSFAAKLNPNNRIYWGVFAGIAAIYANYWDLYFDWGLCRIGKKCVFLREKLVYPAFTYYLAMIFNTLLRFSWVFLLSPNNWGLVNSQLLVFILAFLELLRRFNWTLFRMENEMTNNIGNYRAVREVPLPYKLKKVEVDDEEEDDFSSQKGSMNSRGSASILEKANSLSSESAVINSV
ncbi:hypothetical protein HDU92_004366 [Lobulomyces angularis]|nr:hypothetical protein HDU92_004366 [Lobulomyces angularis]